MIQLQYNLRKLNNVFEKEAGKKTITYQLEEKSLSALLHKGSAVCLSVCLPE